MGTDAPKGKGGEIKTIQKVGAGKIVRWRFRPLALLVSAFSVMVATACGAGSRVFARDGVDFGGRPEHCVLLSGAKEVAKYKGWKVEVGDADGGAEKVSTDRRKAPSARLRRAS